MRLKSRQQYPPGQFTYTQGATNWSAIPGSFDSVVKQVIAHRMGNKALRIQHRWSVDYASVENEVDTFNALKCVSGGWNTFVAEAPTQNFKVPTVFRSLSPSAVGSGIKKVVAGVRAIALWLGDGLTPVAQPLAEGRAATCAVCPKNGHVAFTEEVMAQIREWVAIKNDLALKTSHDAKLGTCTACLCDLRTKVWVPLNIVLKVTTPEVREKLHPACWIKLESETTTKAV